VASLTPLQALGNLLQALLHPIQAVVHTVEAVVHPLSVLSYLPRAIPSVLTPTGPALAATAAPFPSAAATTGSLEVPPSSSASTHAFLLRLIDSVSVPSCTRARGRPTRGRACRSPRQDRQGVALLQLSLCQLPSRDARRAHAGASEPGHNTGRRDSEAFIHVAMSRLMARRPARARGFPDSVLHAPGRSKVCGYVY
jgi:hypothetical protein